MASFDPFPSIREQLNVKIEALEHRASELATLRRAGSSQTEWVEADLRNQYDQANDLLKNISEANKRVAQNPQRFSITPEELNSRNNFVEQSTQRLNMIGKQLNTQQTTSRAADNKSKLRRQAESENQKFIDNELNKQQDMLMEQDRKLDYGLEGVQEINQIANVIHDELVDDKERLDNLDDKMDRRQTDLDRLNKKVLELLNTPKTWMIIGCVVLTIIVVVLFIWVFIV